MSLQIYYESQCQQTLAVNDGHHKNLHVELSKFHLFAKAI